MNLLKLLPAALFLSLACASAPVRAFAEEGVAPAASEEEEEAPKPKPKKGKKKKDPNEYYEKSKYKAYKVDPEPSSYKFSSDGTPVGAKKKVSKKDKKKPLTPPEDEIDGIAPLDDCGSEGVCKEPATKG